MIDLFVAYPGASSEQVAALAIEPLERIMSEIPGVKHVYSASERGQGIVTVRFEVGEPLGPSIVKVHDKLQSNMDKIPPGVGLPLVQLPQDTEMLTIRARSQGCADDGICYPPHTQTVLVALNQDADSPPPVDPLEDYITAQIRRGTCTLYDDVIARVERKAISAALPVTIITAIVSPTTRPIPSITAATIPDSAAGIVTFQRVWSRLAPRAREAAL